MPKMSAAAILQYGAVITKMRAMYTGILKKSDYDTLMSMTRVSDIVRWLKASPGYGNALSSVSDTSIHRNTLESAFDNALVDDAAKLKHMLGRNGRTMLTVLMTRLEIRMLKRILRAVYTGTPVPERGLYRLYPGKTYTNNKYFDPYKCIRAKDFTQLIEALRGSGYDKVLEPFVTAGGIDSTFNMEEALDEYYFKTVLASAEKYLTKSDYIITKGFFDTEADVENILWMYRYKKYYELSEDEILMRLLPSGRRLKPAQLKKLAAADINDFEKAVSETGYKWLFSGSAIHWDSNVSDYLCDLFKSETKRGKYSFAAIMAYFFLKEIDIQNIITIIEGVRYKMEPRRIEEYLILGGRNGH